MKSNTNMDMIIKIVKYVKLNTKIANATLNTQTLKMICNRNYQKKFDEDLEKLLVNTCKFCKHDINRFILILRNSACP